MVTTVNPAIGEVIKHYPVQSKKEAEATIEKVHHAFSSWRRTPMKERAEFVGRIAKEIKAHKSQLAELMTREMGKPIEQSEGEINMCIEIANYTAKEGPKFLQDEERDYGNGKAFITYQPIGVILAMQPWNFPLYQAIRYSLPNLVAGNTTALKHAECVWGTAELIKNIFDKAGVPEGVFELLYVDDETVDELIAHPHVRGVTLTGSAAAGKIVAKIAGQYLKKTLLELGGSDPYIVLEDAPLDDIMQTCVTGRINNAGQTCIAAKRFIVVEKIYDEFKKKFVKAMENVSYGDPMDRKCQMGPMAREDLRENLHEQVKDSIEQGAVCLTGGEIPSGRGFYYPPTVLENISPGMPAYDDELFGPVASLIKVKDEAEAIKVANDHRYGLGGGVFTGDEKRGIEIARSEIDTGMVNVNGYALVQPNLPFGGVKESGYGREHGEFGIREFVNIKTVLVNQ